MPKWLIYSSISMLIWAMWSLLSPVASRDLSGSMIQVLSSVGLIPCALLLLFSKSLRTYTHLGRGLGLALATGLMAGLGNVMLYNALNSGGPASLVFPITSMAPLIPVLLAPILFKEKIRGLQMFGIGVALIAILLLNTTPATSLNPAAFDFFSKWMLYALLALFIFGVTFLTQKGATYFISDELSTVAFTIGFLLLDPILLLTSRPHRWAIPVLAGWVSVSIGFLMGIGSLTLFAAYRYGKASIVTPFSQLFPIITVLVAVPVYHEPLDWIRAIGIVGALAAGIILSVEKTSPTSVPQLAGDETCRTLF
jgi:drug/metabolite transporter (DMT)-like permease